VVNFQDTCVPSGVPSVARTDASTPAANERPPVRAVVGFRVAVFDALSYVMLAGTTEPSGAKSLNVEVVIDAASIDRENVTVARDPLLTYELPSVGVVAVTVGPETVVKLQLDPASAVPSAARMPDS
jgi:hypothetical protein